jgi:hypothetical protein
MSYRDDDENAEEDVDHEIDDNKKVYVSRLPYKWTEAQLAEHFQACFGTVTSTTIKWDSKNDCSLGYGFVVFDKEESRNSAVEQGSMHVKKKTIQIRAVEREESTLGRGRDTGVCYLWQRSACVKGSDCIFLHEGPGACVAVSAFGEGKLKKCMSFKSKGKCSKGDQCPFLHATKLKIGIKTVINETEMKLDEPEKEKVADQRIKFCHTFQKAGKCRKGDSCKFSHSQEATGQSDVNKDPDSTAEIVKNEKKRRRIDGDELVKKMKAAESALLLTIQA